MTEWCKERVWHERFHSQCSRKAWKDGYCKQHHPDTVKARRKKQREKWQIEDRINNIVWNIRETRAECVDLVYKLAGGNKKAAALVKKIKDLEAELENLSK